MAAAPAGTWPSGQRGFVGGGGATRPACRCWVPASTTRSLGAFISVDPETDEYEPQRMHPFAYANNNPVTFADPDGLFFGKIKNAAKTSRRRGGQTPPSRRLRLWWTTPARSAVAGGTVAVGGGSVLPPPAQVVAVAAGAVAAVAGAIDTAKSCVGGDAVGCAMGVASMVPGSAGRPSTAVRGVGAVKNAVKNKPITGGTL